MIAREVEAELERWRHALERRGLKVSRSKTEYLCLNRDSWETIGLQGVEMIKVGLGSTVQRNRECASEVKKRV